VRLFTQIDYRITRAASSGKLPWEMTRSETEELLRTGDKADMPALRELLKAMAWDEGYSRANDPWGIWRTVHVGDEFPRVPLVELSRRRRAMVEKAAAEGKHVPQEVLDELRIGAKPGGDAYLYHNPGMDKDAIESIRRNGLLTEYALDYPHGTDIPDDRKRIYFSPTETGVRGFGDPSARNLMRVRRSSLSEKDLIDARQGRETWFFGKRIPPEDIEIRSNGQWYPLVHDGAGNEEDDML
jgi:hypothetical protein